jgi:hypothetical protein
MGNKVNKKLLYWLALIAIFVLAFFLRFYNLDWDQGKMFHPDERNIAMAVNRLDFPRQNNPEFYAYNGFPIYLIEITSQTMATITNNDLWLTGWGEINLIGRAYSALFSSLAVIVFYLLAKKTLTKKTTLLTTLVFATTVGFIQYAHYGVTESLLVLELLLITWLSMKIIDKPKLKYLISLGIISGLSIGTKTSAISFLLIPFLSLPMAYGVSRSLITKVATFTAIAGLVFFISSPNTLIYLSEFKQSMTYEGGVVRGDFLVPYTMQFIDTTPYLYHLKSLMWQTSPLVVVFGLLGVIDLLIKPKKNLLLLPLAVFSLAYFAYVGFWHTKFIRYLLPVIPFLILAMGKLLASVEKHTKKFTILAFMIAAISLGWALAHQSIYAQPQTRIQASEWIYQHLPENSVLLTEHWDDRLPINLENQNKSYQFQLLKLYEADNSLKIKTLADQLARGDYLILSSRRLSGSIPRNDDYIYTQNYYQLLNSGQLGYQLIKEINVYPNFLGLNIKDDNAEETFRVYDHPRVRIYQNIDHKQPIVLEKILKS